MKTIKGDLIKLALDGRFDVIIHGCNCYCTMGAGIAKAIKNIFPEAYDADCKTEKGSKPKLGSYSSARITKNAHEITVIIKGSNLRLTLVSSLQIETISPGREKGESI